MSDRAAPEVLDTVWIPMPDGVRLAARLWLPAGAHRIPVPAIVEHLPYRRRDGTAARDESTYPVFARAGYAGVRVDLRGSGDSDGIFDDEYSETELADAEAVIAWIAAQPWCSGAVGMMGISWGGFNALQVAARRPPALRAVISIASSVDRYNDDIHYRDGCHLGAHLNWSTTMLGYTARPPDEAVVGERWRAMWLDRLDHIEPAAFVWMAHQRRDAFWVRGSVGDDPGAWAVPALVIAGWGDGYRNTPGKALDAFGAPTKALDGPWIHKYPHFAVPRPRADFHAEALRWWDRWLRGVANGAEYLPAQRAFISEAVRPDEQAARQLGRWVARKRPGGDATQRRLFLRADGALGAADETNSSIAVATPEWCGSAGGSFFVVDAGTELPADQRDDDALSAVFETAPLDDAVDLLGRAQLRVRVALDRPQGNLVARLVDVHPDGAAHRVALGVLNLSHRYDDAEPEPMVAGEHELVDVMLDEAGYRFRAGHRIRLAISTAYFPLVLPPPAPVRAELLVGALSYLDLPTPSDLVDIDVPEPPEGMLPVFPQLTPASSRCTVERRADGQRLVTRRDSDSGEVQHPTNGMVWRETHESTASIGAHDPLSFECIERMTAMRRRDDVETSIVAWSRLTATAEAWCVEGSLVASENGAVVFERTWNRQIRRDHM